MVAKFRALTDKDFAEQPFVRDKFFSNNYEALNYTSSTDYRGDNELPFYSNDTAYVRTHFDLVAPTFNYVLSESNATLLWRILGIRQAVYAPIINFTKVLDLETGELVELNDTVMEGEYLYGAQIAEYYIDQFDVEKAREDCIKTAASAALSQSTPFDSVFTIAKGSGDIHVAGEYYLNFDPIKLQGGKKRTIDICDVPSVIQNTLLANSDSRFTLLYNMPTDKSRLYGMLNYHIMVVPYEMRPKEENREHALTKRYAQVVTANDELRMNLHATPKVVVGAYSKLQRAVTALQYKTSDLPNVKPDDKSAIERIKTKKGQIRFRNLGKRQDYSGRAVVCINPYLPVDVIRIPKAMLPKLYEHHILPKLAHHLELNKAHWEDNTHVDNKYDSISLKDLRGNNAKRVMMDIIELEHLLEHVPVMMGRQPTLHKQSLQGFHVEPTDLTAIEVNPTVCPAFNMDFDGDQAHFEVPLGEKAIEEVMNLVMTTQNLFLAKDGSVTTMPRMDMLYGLYMCTRDTYSPGQSKGAFSTMEEIRQAIMKHKIKPWDTVITPLYGPQLAGDAAFMACFPDGDIVPRGKNVSGKMSVKQVDKKTIGAYMDYALRVDINGDFVYPLGTGRAPVNTIVGMINRLVELGFKVASLYPPNMSLLRDSFLNVKHESVLEEFHKDIEDIEFYYDLGLETHERYSLNYEQRMGTVMKYYKDELVKSLEDDNGYRLLMESGARGNADNLRQTFGIKGRVQKNDTESFDAIIENSYVTQLTSMESMVDAYGGRQGQIDKSLKTGDTGYAMRKMWHGTQGLHITTIDCGTSKGLTIRKSDLRLLSSAEGEAAIKEDVQKIFEHAIIGRFQVGSNALINKDRAAAMAKDDNVTEITLRSPITCECPCCQKCYGIDWSTHKLAVVGLPIGLISAQSVGEPGTQLVLKNFQKGGIVTAGNITSAFDKVDKYLAVSDLQKLYKEGKYSGYDPIAWANGPTLEKPSKLPRMKIVTIEGSSKSIEVPDSLVIQKEAKRGKGLSINHGDYSIRELQQHAGIEFAQFYLTFKLFALYRSEIEIKMCHFEVLVSEMTRYMITKTDRDDLMVGQYCTRGELYAGSIAGTTFIPRLISTKDLPACSMSALDAVIMEDQVAGLARVCALGLTDNLTRPINSMVLAQGTKEGAYYENFIKDRKMRV